ncbi:DNA repair protein complementing XP-G cells homolog [Chelonus insularis]|uniref:DNA repair protein complementing XP-G cells homolog n=1 Tax=Chelonus insularis TaxID=460826 RepID=UPI00158BEFB6|nr:DNA repair protein complementing XP-G cells homolog [Chelonus insularis]XP_034934630.1 DNA repair protein complementing XP-G cells homolog [Chelonus insularis]
MGVTGLWRLIDASGKPVPVETLEGKILAIDISIWIYQVLQGYQDRRGHAVPNAHLLGLYNRICKLLYFKIKPVFIFDGGVPLLKKNTIAARKKHKAQLAGTAEKMKNDLLHNLMKHSLVKGVLAKQVSEKEQSTTNILNSNIKRVDDIFKLPELSSNLTEDHDSNDSDNTIELSPRKQVKWKGNIHNVDVNTDDFKSLPADVRYDILTDLKETRKQNSWGRLHEMPEDSQQFSGFQMKRLLKRRQVQESLEAAEREMGGKTLTLEELEKLMIDQGVDTKRNDKVFRIASNSTSRVIYINDPTNLKSNQENFENILTDLNQPSCSKNITTHAQLSAIPEESNSLIENINEYDLDDEWDSELKIVNKVVESPIIKKFFSKSSNPVLAYMQAQSGLSQEKILEFIQQNKEMMNNTAKNTETKRSKRKRVIIENKKIFAHNKRARVDSETCLETIEEMIQIKEEINSSDSAQDNDEQIERIKQKSSPPFENKTAISSESDSEDFVEVTDVPIPDIFQNKKIEITVKTDEKPNNEEDIFADIFETEPTEFNSLSELSFQEQSSEFLKNIKLNSSAQNYKSSELLQNNYFDDLKIEKLNPLIEEKFEINKTITNDSNRNNFNLINEKSLIQQSNKVQLIGKEFLNHEKENKNVPETVIKVSANISVDSKNNSSPTNIKPIVNINNNEHPLINLINKQQILSEEMINAKEIRKSNFTSSENVSPINNLITIKSTFSQLSSSETLIQEKKPSERVEQIITKLKNDEAEILTKVDKEEDLLDMRSQLEDEHQELVENIGKLERQATEVTEQMRSEAQELLRLFGIPYVIAPQEAEAQCAYLELLNLTDGTITDDSDIWLFGGRCVYKNFFNNDKKVMQYLIKDIEHHFKLTRPQMIQLALLVGSDYTLGIPGIGPVTALEILANFPSEGDDILQGLINFATWLRAGKIAAPGRTTLRNKLKNITVDLGFPSQAVAQAYLFPSVDESTEPFSWSKPNVVLLSDYTREKFGWTKIKFEEVMGPVMKKFLNDKSQKNLLNYFKIETVPRAIKQNLSKRVQKAVKMMGKEDDENEDSKNDDSNDEIEKKVKKKPKKQSANKKNIETIETSIEIFEDYKKNTELLETKFNVQQNEKRDECIPQREKDKTEALQKKLKAIEVFRKSTQGKKKTRKRLVRRPKNIIKKEAKLSESSSDSN